MRSIAPTFCLRSLQCLEARRRISPPSVWRQPVYSWSGILRQESFVTERSCCTRCSTTALTTRSKTSPSTPLRRRPLSTDWTSTQTTSYVSERTRPKAADRGLADCPSRPSLTVSTIFCASATDRYQRKRCFRGLFVSLWCCCYPCVCHDNIR